MMKDYSTIKNFDELIDLEYGEIGTESRYEFEKSSKLFIESEMRKEAKREANQHPEQTPTKTSKPIEISPLVKSLRGVAKLDKDFDFKKEYANYLAEKYKWERRILDIITQKCIFIEKYSFNSNSATILSPTNEY